MDDLMEQDGGDIHEEYHGEIPGYTASTCSSRLKSRAEMMTSEVCDHRGSMPHLDTTAGLNGDTHMSERNGHKVFVGRARGLSMENVSTRPPRKKPTLAKPVPRKQGSLDLDYASTRGDTASNRSVATTRSISAWSLMSVPHSQPPTSPRDNIASLRRKQMSKLRGPVIPAKDALGQQYLTPSQRKDKLIQDLRTSLDEMHEKIARNEEQVEELLTKRDANMNELLAARDGEIGAIQSEIEKLKLENTDLQQKVETSTTERDELKKQITNMEEVHEKREDYHREMYLHMFEKGKKSAEFVRQDTLEEIAAIDPDSVSVPELLQKLKDMQVQLTTLQSTERANSYEAGLIMTPATDSEATLRCVRDAFYHHLTETDKKSRRQHLDIMINLAGFTAPQLRRIERCLVKNKSKS